MNIVHVKPRYGFSLPDLPPAGSPREPSRKEKLMAAEFAFYAAPASEADEAFDRWLELCSTPDEAFHAAIYSSGSREEKARAKVRALGGTA